MKTVLITILVGALAATAASLSIIDLVTWSG
jgi:hypothetical protein